MSHILVADDEPDICHLVRLQMERLGHTCEIATNGHEALAALHTTKFDLAILDNWMPLLTGIEIVKQVRDVGPDRSLPIILMSAFAGDADIHRGIEAGADAYVTKPMSLAPFRAQVQQLLGQTSPKYDAPDLS